MIVGIRYSKLKIDCAISARKDVHKYTRPNFAETKRF